jgi:hypothetical protein
MKYNVTSAREIREILGQCLLSHHSKASPNRRKIVPKPILAEETKTMLQGGQNHDGKSRKRYKKAQQIVPEMGKDWSELSEGYEGEGGLLRAT